MNKINVIKELLAKNNEVEIWVKFRKSKRIVPFVEIKHTLGKSIVINAPCWLGDKFKLKQKSYSPVIADSTDFLVSDENTLTKIIEYIFRRFDVRQIRYGTGFFKKNIITIKGEEK